MLIKRIATAVVGAPLTILLVLIGGPAFVGALAVVAGMAAREAMGLLGISTDDLIWSAVAAVSGAALVVSGAFGPTAELALLAGFLIVALALFLVESTERSPGWTKIVAAAVYPGLPLSLLVAIRQWMPNRQAQELSVFRVESGAAWVLLALTTVWATDATAFLVGRTLGRRRLWTRVSPNKTWEGTIAGIMAGAIVCLAWAPIVGLDLVLASTLGLAIAIATVFGDLVESAMKRSADVKDSGRILPGHGGVLDRIDGLLFAAVVVFLWGIIGGVARASAAS